MAESLLAAAKAGDTAQVRQILSGHSELVNARDTAYVRCGCSLLRSQWSTHPCSALPNLHSLAPQRCTSLLLAGSGMSCGCCYTMALTRAPRTLAGGAHCTGQVRTMWCK